MGGIKTWLLGIVLTAFAGGLAQELSPKGREQTAVRLVSGLLLALAILRPLAGLGGGELPEFSGDFAGQAQAQAAAYEKSQREQLSAIIAARTEAYILDKADQLGVACQAVVEVSAGDGLPMPERVTIIGAYHPALAACIEEEVGIPAAQQNWLEEREWSEKERG